MSGLAFLTGLAAGVAVLLSTSSRSPVGRVSPAPSALAHRGRVMPGLVAILMVTVMVGILLGSPILTLGVPAMAGVGWLGIAAESRARIARRKLAMAPVVVELIAQRLRAGGTALTTLRALDRDQAEAVGTRSVIAEVNAGASLVQALAQERGPNGLLRAALMAVELSGGAGAGAVERLADRLRLSAGAEASARSQSGQQLASASLMAGLPPVIALLYALSDRRAANFYTNSPGGALVIVSSFALSGLSWLWMRWILQSRSVR